MFLVTDAWVQSSLSRGLSQAKYPARLMGIGQRALDQLLAVSTYVQNDSNGIVM